MQEKGNEAYKTQNFKEALESYNDALDIDEKNIDALASRAATYIEMENFALAHKDTEKLLMLNPNHPQVGCIYIVCKIEIILQNVNIRLGNKYMIFILGSLLVGCNIRTAGKVS